MVSSTSSRPLTARAKTADAPPSFNAALLAAEEVYEDELGEVAGGGEVGLPRCHLRHPLDELDEVVVRGQHEGVNHHPRLAARLHLAEGGLHHQGVAAHRVLVEAAAPAQ